MLRGILGWIGGIVVLIAVGLPAVFAIALDPGDRAVHFFQRAWGRLTMAWLRLMGVRLVYRGLDRLPTTRSSVLAANHQSLLDILILSAIQPPHTRWVMKSELKNVPIVGWGTRLAGFIFVDRRGDPASVRRSFEDTQRRLGGASKVMNILFFIEGTRTRDGHLREFKRGAFRVAAQHEMPVVPIVIDGAFGLLPRGWITLQPGNVVITVLPSIEPAKGESWDAETLRERTRLAIAEQLGESPSSSTATCGSVANPDEIVCDDHWREHRALFDRLYSGPRAIPWVHRGCATGGSTAQYLRRDGEDMIWCPGCNGRVEGAARAQLD